MTKLSQLYTTTTTESATFDIITHLYTHAHGVDTEDTGDACRAGHVRSKKKVTSHE